MTGSVRIEASGVIIRNIDLFGSLSLADGASLWLEDFRILLNSAATAPVAINNIQGGRVYALHGEIDGRGDEGQHSQALLQGNDINGMWLKVHNGEDGNFIRTRSRYAYCWFYDMAKVDESTHVDLIQSNNALHRQIRLYRCFLDAEKTPHRCIICLPQSGETPPPQRDWDVRECYMHGANYHIQFQAMDRINDYQRRLNLIDCRHGSVLNSAGSEGAGIYLNDTEWDNADGIHRSGNRSFVPMGAPWYGNAPVGELVEKQGGPPEWDTSDETLWGTGGHAGWDAADNPFWADDPFPTYWLP